MGEFILCTEKKAEKPFFHETMSVHLYTLEELCYYMETNLFLLDKSWVGEELFSWIGGELGQEKLAGQLRQAYGKEGDIYSAAELIFQESGLYSRTELTELSGLVESMRGKTEMECRKMRADRLLEAGRYRRAAYTYFELLSPEYEIRMTEELRGNILHNLGVVYARLFLFAEAAEMFALAWKTRPDPASREAYLFCQNFLPESSDRWEQEMDLNFAVMRDALAKFSEVSDGADCCRERREASLAAEAFDWRGEQEKLLRKWYTEYEKML